MVLVLVWIWFGHENGKLEEIIKVNLLVRSFSNGLHKYSSPSYIYQAQSSHSPRFFCDLPQHPYDGAWSTHGQLHISLLMMSMLQKTSYRRVNNMLKISCYDKKNIGQWNQKKYFYKKKYFWNDSKECVHFRGLSVEPLSILSLNGLVYFFRWS